MNESFLNVKDIIPEITKAFMAKAAAIAENVKQVDKLNAAYGKLPSDYLKTITEITQAQRNQAEAERNLVTQTERLTRARTANSNRTQEEITNTRLLAQNANLAATANSTFANSFQRLVAQQTIAARKLQDLIATGRQGTQTQNQYNREVRAAQAEFDRLNARVTLANRAVRRFHDNVGNYPTAAIKGLRDLIGAFGIVGGVTAFAALAKDVFNTTRELQSLDLALKNVTGSQEAFGQAQEFLNRVSEAYGIEIQGLTRSYTGFLAASQNAIESGKITAAQIQDIFESVSKASGAMGLSVDAQQGAFLALQQMISKGNVQAEEIRGQLAERLPGAFGILAKSMGVTEVELNKLLKDGKVLATDVLPAFAKELEKAYGVENLQRVESLNAETSRLSNAWTSLVREITEGNSLLTKSFISVVSFAKGATQGLEELAKSEKQRRDEQLNKIEENGYIAQLDLLKQMNEEEKALAKFAATETLSSGQDRLKELREQRDLLNENISLLESQGKGAGNYEVIQLNNQYNKSLDQTNLILGQMRAASEFLNPKKDKVPTFAGTAKKQKADIDYLKEVYNLRRQNTENEIAGQEDIMNNEAKNYDIRLAAANNYFFQKEKLIELEREEQMRLNDLTFKNQKEQYSTAISEGKATLSNLAELEYQHVLKKETINTEYEGKKSELAIANAKKLKGVLDSIEDKSRVNIVDEQELENIRQLNLELVNVTSNTTYAKFKEIEEKKTKIVEDATEQRIQIELQRTREQINALSEDEKNSKVYQDLRGKEISLQKDLAEAEQARLEKTKELTLELKRATDSYLTSLSSGFFSDAGLDSLNQFLQMGEDGLTEFERRFAGAGDNINKKFAVTFAAITQVAAEAFSFLNQQGQQQFDLEAERLEQRKELALKYAGENQDAQDEINRQYEEREKESKRRQLEYQKQQLIFQTLATAAAAAVAAYASQLIPGDPTSLARAFNASLITLGIGAAQAAFIASQQIPAFAEGGVTEKDGNILVNDAKGSNYKEVVVTPRGKTIKPQGRNRVINVPKNTRIFKSYAEHENALNNILGNAGIAPNADSMNRSGAITVAQSGGITREDIRGVMLETLGSMPVTNHKTVWDETGVRHWVEHGHSSMEFRNRYLEFSSKNIGK
jgi:tape measure domain-containing protein